MSQFFSEYTKSCSTGVIFRFNSLFFIIFFANISYINETLDYVNYVDDTTPCVCRLNFVEVFNFLGSNIEKISA